MTTQRTLPQLDRIITVKVETGPRTSKGDGSAQPHKEETEYRVWAARQDARLSDEIVLASGGVYPSDRTRFLVRDHPSFKWKADMYIESDGVRYYIEGVSEAALRGGYMYLLARSLG